VDSEYYGISQTDKDTEDEDLQVFISEITTPYTLDCTTSLSDGTVYSSDTLQIEWDHSGYIQQTCYIQVVLPSDFTISAASDITL
jgi:hypothetical protein